jgi:hypothetical protein
MRMPNAMVEQIFLDAPVSLEVARGIHFECHQSCRTFLVFRNLLTAVSHVVLFFHGVVYSFVQIFSLYCRSWFSSQRSCGANWIPSSLQLLLAFSKGWNFRPKGPWIAVGTFSPSLRHSCQSQSYITTDGQSASLSWGQAPIWDPRPFFPLFL